MLVLLGLSWLRAVCSPGICHGASSFHKLCQGLQESFVKGCRRALSRAAWPGTALLEPPSMSPQLGKGPLDEERSGSRAGRWNASLERRSRKCCELIRAGLACLDKPRWACKALNPGRTKAYGSCAVGFTQICFQQAACSLQSLLLPVLAVAELLPSPGQQHRGSPGIHTASLTAPRLSADWSSGNMLGWPESTPREQPHCCWLWLSGGLRFTDLLFFFCLPSPAADETFSFKYSPGKLRGNQYKSMMSKEELEEEQR